ncbi:hypothetical protein BAY06_04750 [Elizabethkingia anophelis]|uniref:conjugal transfer protein TraO n=1 Tax=Elizabethkingia anophelis TaxID=1117645 RepID=UPI00099AF9D4|nr:conjugal transfer protein TraO [Elizabethkingia anophelis]OPC51636.1 hypothetical protein BAY06_04750 [Elizabethkingia anophelis]
MKKYISSILLCIICTTAIHAQRMLPRQQALEFTTGSLTQEQLSRNYYIQLGFLVFGKNGNHQLWSVEFNNESSLYYSTRIPIMSVLAEGGYSLRLWADPGRNITINAAFTAAGGYETFNAGKKTLMDGSTLRNQDSFIYGGAGRLSVDTYLSDHIVLLVQGRLKALWGTSREHLRPSLGIGIRYNF